MKTIEIPGDVDLNNIRSFYTDLSESITENNEVILDFKNLDRIDAALLQVVVSGQQFARFENKIIKIKNISDEIKRQLKISGLIK